MFIIRFFACALLALVISCSQAWAGTTQIDSYPALRDALEQGEVPIIGVIDFAQCTSKSQKTPDFRGKEITIFKRNAIYEDGTVSMLTTYKVNTLMDESKWASRLPDRTEDMPVWIEWQSGYDLSSQDDKEFKVKFIAADAKTGKTLITGDYRCPLGSAIKLWRTPHGL